MTGIDPDEVSRSKPARCFPETFLLGNGFLGASVHGRASIERIDVNLDSLWSGGPTETSFQANDPTTVRDLRSAVAVGDHAGADVIARSLQGPGWTQSYQPLGALLWHWSDTVHPQSYVRRLRLEDAVVRTEADESWYSLFVSAPDGVIVGLCAPGAEGSLDFQSPHPSVEQRSEANGVRWLTASGRVPRNVLPNYVDLPNPVQYGTDDLDADGLVSAGMGWALVAADVVRPDGSRLFVSAAESGFRGWSRRPSGDGRTLERRARERVRRALTMGYEELFNRHRVSHRELYSRVKIDLTSARSQAALAAQQYFNLGRYLLISSSRPGSQAANLQGIWNVDVRPPWSSNYTLNINTPMNYWGAEVSGLPELHEPFLELARDLADAGRETAGRLYDAPGAAVHHNTDIWRHTTPVPGNPEWSNWATALAWLSSHFAEHRAFGGDIASPHEAETEVVTAAARFLEASLVPGRRGLLVSPSTSPENTFDFNGGRYAVTAGSTMDQEFALSVLQRFLEFAQERGDTASAELTAARLKQVQRPEVGSDGRLVEWAAGYAPTEQGHRHLSHLYGVFPGDRITPTADAQTFRAARAALDARLRAGSGYTGWSQAWVLALAARFGDAPLARQSLATLIEELSSTSLLGLHPHPGWPEGVVFQIDANLGAVAGICEMLLQSHDNAISLLPALPEEWSSGSFQGLRSRGGFCVDASWRLGALEAVTVRGRPGATVVLEVSSDIEWNEEPDLLPNGPAGPDDRRRRRWTTTLPEAGVTRFTTNIDGGRDCLPPK